MTDVEAAAVYHPVLELPDLHNQLLVMRPSPRTCCPSIKTCFTRLLQQGLKAGILQMPIQGNMLPYIQGKAAHIQFSSLATAMK